MPPCVAIPKPPLPDLPAPLSFTPPQIPKPPEVPTFCCKLPPAFEELFGVTIPVIPGVGINPALIAAIKGYLAAALAYFNKIPLDCPRE